MTRTNGPFARGARRALALSVLPAVLALATGSAAKASAEATLADKAAAAARRASEGHDAAKRGTETVTPLAGERKKTLAALPAKQRDFDKHVRAGAAAEKKYETLKASAKPKTDPNIALQTAKTEYEQATQLGDEIVKATSGVRATEDTLTTAVDAAATAASDAKTASDEVKASLDGLQATAVSNASETTKAATTAKQGASKARTAAGLGTPESYAKKKEQNQKDDEKLAGELGLAKTSLAAVMEARKAKKKPPPAWVGDVAGAAGKAAK